jgi:hypothetical protein
VTGGEGWVERSLQDYHTIKMHIEKLVMTQAHHDQQGSMPVQLVPLFQIKVKQMV